MSITQWVCNTFDSDEEKLEESKNFVFIWGLFESQLNQSLQKIDIPHFKSWVKNLEVINGQQGVILTEPNTGLQIQGDLIKNIHKAFNHFHQLYINDEEKFLNHLYNQNDKQTQDAKSKFTEFISSLKKSNIKDKIIFLFLIAKRMRNKFFHGIKNIGDICSEQKEFKKINGYLIAIISLVENYPK